ncbi:hypothetical protein ACLOJK_015310 [Asimina triloba]
MQCPCLRALFVGFLTFSPFFLDLGFAGDFWNKFVSGHSVTLHETLSVSSAKINGATAFEMGIVSALSNFSNLQMVNGNVISGINKGLSAVAGAREALICDVPSLSISLNWKKDESHETIRDIEKGFFPASYSLNIENPTSPSTNKVFHDGMFLKAVVDAGELVWNQGLLKRFGICHDVELDRVQVDQRMSFRKP